MASPLNSLSLGTSPRSGAGGNVGSPAATGGSSSNNNSNGNFPLPVSFHFCPGGIRAPPKQQQQQGPLPPPARQQERYSLWKVQPALIGQAAAADTRLNQYSRWYQQQSQQQQPQQDFRYAVPSLSVLAEAAFGRLSGCGAQMAKDWADAMVCSYARTACYDQNPDGTPFVVGSEADLWRQDFPVPPPTPAASAAQQQQHLEAGGGTSQATTTVVSLLKQLSASSPAESQAKRPCGYVFQRGDIAWNCRTCQTDPTCVICDSCFRASNHDGHEVYFHRTTPGGCCDCGDAEAWRVDGCCPQHRPDTTAVEQEKSNSEDDPMEAVRMAQDGFQSGEAQVVSLLSLGSPRLVAALAAVVGAAVQVIVDANDGAAIGADPTQWRMRWADEAARIANRVDEREEYYYTTNSLVTPAAFFRSSRPIDDKNADGTASVPPNQEQTLPEGYRLQLRLHNDDVHTFDEVIDALHEPRMLRRHSDPNSNEQSLVPLRDSATEMTHHVDADGQVTVKTYATISAAMQGYRRLKSRGLHCSVVSTAQVQLELRARALMTWLTEISTAHPAAAALVVHALVQVDPQHMIAHVPVWPQPRFIPAWVAMDETDEVLATRKRFQAFPPNLLSSYVTREEAELLHGIAVSVHPTALCQGTGAAQDFYTKVPYRLPPERYRKSPHALWGTLPSFYNDPVPPASKHPLLHRLVSGNMDITIENRLTEDVFVVDTDLRKQQEADRITTSVYPHKLPGLNLISGVGTVRATDVSAVRPPLPSPMDWRHLLATCSFRAPVSPILLLLLLDPYPTKQMRSASHALFLSLLTDSRFRSRFAGAIGIAYRPLSTLFCAGVGTEADTPLHFTVQIFTAGSLIRALGNAAATEQLMLSDKPNRQQAVAGNSIGVFASPIAHTIVRCIHTNLLGATKEVNMILNNTFSGNDDDSHDDANSTRNNDGLLPALTYVAGEHALLTPLPAAPDDGFLDSRSTRHKRLPHLLRDLEYVIETPGTALRLLLPHLFAVYQGPSLSSRGEDVLSFPSVYSRMLRLSQGMDPQKRKISGGHVEYEQNRWLEAFGLSLNFAGTRDALAESPMSSGTLSLSASKSSNQQLQAIREAAGNLVASLLREIKFWLYREGLLETGLPVTPAHGSQELAQAEALQRSTLHVSGSQFDISNGNHDSHGSGELEASLGGASVSTVALACATGVKMTETQLSLIENALKADAAEKMLRGPGAARNPGPVMGDWLRVPHSPLAGDSLSFHLPLHRALAKCVRSICSVVVPEEIRSSFPGSWWKIPVLDSGEVSADPSSQRHHPLVPLIRSTLRSSNCRVVWNAGPECSSQGAQQRRARSRTVSANIAVAKILHSLADHPIRCIAAAQQIERHLWARNGSSVAGMAMNYSSTPLCRSFRDLDVLLAQLSASGMSCGLGARRVFALLLSRFSMDGYLCDPERRSHVSGGPGSYGSVVNVWVNPPRLQDPDHAVVLSESLFSTLCVIVSELPPPPPISPDDDSSLRQTIRRELLHALAAEPRSHSEAMTAASSGVSRREEAEGGSGSSCAVAFREVFSEVLRDIATQKGQRSSRATSGPPLFELKAACCDEYDPTFFHLRRQEHQHAMDVVSRLRKQKHGDEKEGGDRYCFPLVCSPPKAHPRFLPCRLLLHLQAMDGAIRRSLLFALTGGSWLPPPEPSSVVAESEKALEDNMNEASDMVGISYSSMSSPQGEVPVSTFPRRLLGAHQHSSSTISSSMLRRTSASSSDPIPFSQEVVAASSVSFLEVLQLLTLQVHTLEECASLHRTLPDLDDESRTLSSGLSINSYLGRLIGVPESLVDVWALKPYPEGPLQSKGSGERRGSILGLLIALYEHRADHSSLLDSNGGEGATDEHGGARSLATSGLKWLLRFVNALVDGAKSVGAATKSATSGIPILPPQGSHPSPADLSSPSWTIDDEVRTTVRAMLSGLPDLWPKERQMESPSEKNNAKSKEARRAAQQRVLDMMKRKQAAFAATIAPSEKPTKDGEEAETETDLCIICRCDDTDGENNGPLGYLGHVQRSRVVQMRATTEGSSSEGPRVKLFQSYRVVGHMGCQLRESHAMDSRPLTCLPKGSIVTALKTKVSTEYDVLSRRVLVRHLVKDPNTGADIVTEGWASVQSSQGYVILSPLSNICYTNSAWGGTRPIIKQCGHAAHLKCVETHTLSLHQRAAGDQPYDGRFAANISDGEFLCPLCKQLSNILIPRDNFTHTQDEMDVDDGPEVQGEDSSATTALSPRPARALLAGSRLAQISENNFRGLSRRALKDFGAHLYNAMSVPWERSGSRKRLQQHWHPSIQKWDYEEEEEDDDGSTRVKSVLRLLRQQLIAWAAVGHSAASSEASVRGIEEKLPFGIMSQTNDPWSDYGEESRDSHHMLLELKRTLTGACGLLEVLSYELKNTLAGSRAPAPNEVSVIGVCLADIIEGRSWLVSSQNSLANVPANDVALWSELSGFTSAMPSHVARDGVLAHKCEARAAAAAMWALKGIGTSTAPGDPPTPLAINRVIESGLPPISRDWGTLEPYVYFSNQGSCPEDDAVRCPFRPGVASAYLYKPLLVWDLYTFAGAVLSSSLANSLKDLPSSEDLVYLAQMLLTGRMVQAIVTPFGFEQPDELEIEDDECWNGMEVQSESSALQKLVSHCQATVKNKSLEIIPGLRVDNEATSARVLLAGIGQAILPFARALVLMLRACTAAIRERRAKGKAAEAKSSPADKLLDSVLFSDELLTVEDGFAVVKALHGPLPSALVDTNGEWKKRIDKWLVSAIGFELHHGSVGKTVMKKQNTADTSETANLKLSAAGLSSGKTARGWSSEKASTSGRGEMEIDDTGATRRFTGSSNNVLMDDVEDSEDDEEILAETDDIEEAEEMVEFAGQIMGGVGALFQANSPSGGLTDGNESDDNSSSGSEGDGRGADRAFAHVSRSPILPYQPSFLALEDIGPGRQGTMYECSAASSVMADLSHMALLHRKEVPTFSLIRLPSSFVELYNVVNKVKGRDESANMEDNDDSGSSEAAICLLTGAVMRSGSSRRGFTSRSSRPPGACTMHARKHGSGIGIFFLVQKCTVLLMHNNKSAYSPSIFVDEHGEEDPGLRRGRPLFLNEARYRALEGLWRQQGIPREVAQIRSTSDRVIRDNWY